MPSFEQDLSYKGRNPITSIDGLEGFSRLKTFVMEREYQQHRPRAPEILLKFTVLQSLEKLVLSNIILQTIPAEFEQLKKLKCLFLEHCELTSIDRISECCGLEKINVSNNKIKVIPVGFKKLRKLENLVLHRNLLELSSQASYLPEMLQKAQKEGHTNQIQLKVLDLSLCQIKGVPLNFSALINLELLNLSNNEILSLQEAVFQHMQKLRYLNLSHNRLKILPDLSVCQRLVKLQIAYNMIEELPQFLANTQIEQFSFEGCPIKHVACVNWLRAVLNDNSSILQKYLYWVEKIAPYNQIVSQSKCSTRLLSIDDPDELSSDEQENKYPASSDSSHLAGVSASLIQDNSEDSDNNDEASENRHFTDVKEKSQISSHLGNFFTSVRKRVSLSMNQEEDYSESEQQQPQIQQSEIEASQAQFQKEDMHIQKQITPEVIGRYFEDNQWLVFEFQSKMRYSQSAVLFCKEINLYHDASTPQTASKFLQMILGKAIKCPTINVYAVPFLSNFKNLQLQDSAEQLNKGILYDSLRKNQMPFVYAATLQREKEVELRGSETIQIPPFILTDQLTKLSLYNCRQPDTPLTNCARLLKLKVRKCKWTTLPFALTELHALEVLDLTRNEIITIDTKILAGLSNLKVLLLAQNKLKQVPAVNQCSQLEVLSLSFNPIQLIPECLKTLSWLKVFEINQCPLRAIYCKDWVCSKLKPDEILVHLCQFSLWKAHQSNLISYRSQFKTAKMLCCELKEEGEQEQYKVGREEQERKFFQFFESRFKENEFKMRFSEDQFIAFRFIHKTKYQRSGPAQLSIFKLIHDQQQPQVVNKFRGYLQHHHLHQALLRLNQIRFVTYPTTNNIECIFCGSHISYPYYWLKWEYSSPAEWLDWKDQPKFGCRPCIEEHHPKQYFRYLKNSVLMLQKPAFCRWPSRNFGNNLQPAQITQKNRHNFECDGCGATVFDLGDPRYVCLGCKSGDAEEKKEDLLDLCKDCIAKVISKGPQLPRSLHKFNHKDWHTFLRILFNTQGYYVY